MPKYTAPPNVSVHPAPGLSFFDDVCVESDITSSATDSDDDEHTLTAFGDVSLTEEYMIGSATNDVRRLNPLCLKVKRPPFPKKRKSVPYSPKSLAGRFFDSSGPPLAPSPLSPSLYFESFLRHSPRSDKRHAAQCSQSDSHGVEAETQPHAAVSQGSTSGSSNYSYDYEPGQSIIVKDVPSVAEAPEPAKS